VDFNEKLAELESEIENKVDKATEVIDGADRKEVDALLELANEDESETSSADDSAKDKAQTEKTEEEDLTPGTKKEGEEDSTGKKEGEDKADEAPENTPVQITEEYISKADEKDRNILSRLKGRTLDEIAIKMYVDSQREIGRLGQKVGQNKPENEKPEAKKAIPEVIPQQQLTADVQALKETEVINRLRNSYPELPDDPKEIDEYLEGLPIRQQLLYTKREESIREQVGKDFDKAIYIQNHKDEINNSVVDTDVSNILSELKEYDIEDPAKLGFDLSITRDSFGRVTSVGKTLVELMTTDGKNLDPKVISYIGETPIFNEGALAAKFFTNNGKIIRDALKAQIKIKASVDTVNKITEKAEKADNTATIAKGNATTTKPKKITKAEEIEELDRDSVKKLLEES
jgi:hypothetical protein